MWVLPFVVFLIVGGCCRCQGRFTSTGPKEKIFHDYTFDSKESIQIVDMQRAGAATDQVGSLNGSGISSGDELVALVAARSAETHLDDSGGLAAEAARLLSEGRSIGRRRALALVSRLLERCCARNVADAADAAKADDLACCVESAAAYLDLIPAAVWTATTRRISSLAAVTPTASGCGASSAKDSSFSFGSDGGVGGTATSPTACCKLSNQDCLEVYDYLKVVHAAAMITNNGLACGDGLACGGQVEPTAAAAAAAAAVPAAEQDARAKKRRHALIVVTEADGITRLFVDSLRSFLPLMNAAALHFPALQHALLAILRVLIDGNLVEGPTATACLSLVFESAFFDELLLQTVGGSTHANALQSSVSMSLLQRRCLWSGVILVAMPALCSIIEGVSTTVDASSTGLEDAVQTLLKAARATAMHAGLRDEVEYETEDDGRPEYMAAVRIRDGFFDALAEQDDAIASGLLFALRLDTILFPTSSTHTKQDVSIVGGDAEEGGRSKERGGRATGGGAAGGLLSARLHEVCATLMRNATAKNCIRALQADHLFVQFIELVAFDHLVLVDLLISNETCFLEYLLLYSRRLGSCQPSWEKLVVACRERDVRLLSQDADALKSSDADLHGGNNNNTTTTAASSATTTSPTDHHQPGAAAAGPSRSVVQVSELLIRVRLALERLARRNLFPYNPNPLIIRLEQVEKLYTLWLTNLP